MDSRDIPRYLNDPGSQFAGRPPPWTRLTGYPEQQFLTVWQDQVCFVLERSELPGYDYAAKTCVVRDGSQLDLWARHEHATGSSTRRGQITYTAARGSQGCALALATLAFTAIAAAAYAAPSSGRSHIKRRRRGGRLA